MQERQRSVRACGCVRTCTRQPPQPAATTVCGSRRSPVIAAISVVAEEEEGEAEEEVKRLLLYTTAGCGGSERLAASNPPSYRVIFLPNTNPNCSVTSVLFERRALLFRSHARDTVYACSCI